jgi:hypothetical protein
MATAASTPLPDSPPISRTSLIGREADTRAGHDLCSTTRCRSSLCPVLEALARRGWLSPSPRVSPTASNINVQELTVAASLTGKREHVYKISRESRTQPSVWYLGTCWSSSQE